MLEVVLSIITGRGKWVEIKLSADPLYQHLLLTAEKKFWRCVENGEPPRRDHLVGAGEQRWMDCQSERLIGLEYDQLEFGRLLHWHLTRVFIPPNAIYIRSRASIQIDRTYAIED
jgi:hypothetical protein